MSQDAFRYDDRGAVPQMHATTILMVRKGGRVVIGGDGQVSLGQTIVKGNARKVRRLAKGAVIGGFAGAPAAAARAADSSVFQESQNNLSSEWLVLQYFQIQKSKNQLLKPKSHFLGLISNLKQLLNVV